MTVVRIAVYPIDASKVDELQDSVDSRLIPLYRQQPGCQALSLTHCGDSVVSVTRWDSQSTAEQGSQAAIGWAKTAPGSTGPPSAVHIGSEMNST